MPADHRKKYRKEGEWEKKRKQKESYKTCKTLSVLSQELFFSLWSIHSWTLWHLICRADETSPCLNWSGFVSSLLSHDPLLYGSMRGGGNPHEYTALVGLLFASYRPTERMLDWSYFMLGLPLSSTLLHRIFCSLRLPPFFFSFCPPPIPLFLKPLMQQEGRKASVTVWNYCDFMEVQQLNRYTFPSGVQFCLKCFSSFFFPSQNALNVFFKTVNDPRLLWSAFLVYFVKNRLTEVTIHHSDLLPTACCVMWCENCYISNVTQSFFLSYNEMFSQSFSCIHI